MARAKKLSIKKMVEQADAAKKVNPLDLSSDQDLSVALMNLISLEEHFMFSGAKTQKTGYYDLINTVHDMRVKLMARVVRDATGADGVVWDMSTRLLAAAMRLSEVGTKALSAGRADDAYKLFDQAYELYSLFWGINMGLVDLDGVQKIAPDVVATTSSFPTGVCPLVAKKSRSTVKKLGDWVKNAVNCCIE